MRKPAHKPKRILCIADDLTGAAEIAGVGFRHGLPSRITFDGQSAIDDGLLVLDTETRLAIPHESQERIVKLLSRIDLKQFDLIFKKCDSILRGPVLTEIETVLDVFHMDRALLVPQNPSIGRTIHECVYLVDGVPLTETEFAEDPDYPAWTCNVLKRLGSSDRFQTQCVQKPIEIPPKTIIVGEADSTESLRAFAQQHQPEVLRVGGMDFFEAILAQVGFKPVRGSAPPTVDGRLLIVTGSASEQARSFTREMADAGLPVLRMPEAIFNHGVSAEAEIEQWSESIIQSLNKQELAVVTIDRPIVRTPGTGTRLQSAMRRVMDIVLHQTKIDMLMVAGGATAHAVLVGMGLTELQVQAELGRGVVHSRGMTGSRSDIISKPGSYRWPDELIQSLKARVKH